MKSYKDLEIYTLSYELAVKVHKMTLRLPKYEMYEEGSQVRRSSKGVLHVSLMDTEGRNTMLILSNF